MRQDGIDSRYYVRSLIEVEMAAIVEGVCNRDGPPALDTDNRIQLPTRAEPADPVKCGKIIIEGCGETMPGVKESVPAFRSQVAWILRKRSAGHKVDAVGSIVDRVRPDIARETREAVRILQADNRLQRMVDRRSPRKEFIDRAVIGVGKEFIEIRQAHKFDSLAADVTDLDGRVFRESLLNIQIPILAVRTGKFPRSHKNRVRPRRVYGQDWSGGIGVGAVESRGVEVHRQHRFRPNGIGSDAGGRSEVRNQQVLRDVVVVDPIACANHRAFENVPGESQTGAEIVQIALVKTIQPMCSD